MKIYEPCLSHTQVEILKNLLKEKILKQLPS